MGFITLVRFYNDYASELLDNSKEFCRGLYGVLAGGKWGGIGNIAKVFPSMHDSNSSTYVLNGGEVDEMDPYSSETIRLMQQNPERFASNLKFLRVQVRALERMFKDYKSDTPSQ